MMTKKSSIFPLFTKGKRRMDVYVDALLPSPFSIFPSVSGRRVSDGDGALVNHSNDSQKRWLHKETHVCSPFFKCPA